MALSVRTRFEVFKRDQFTCQYCGRKSPDAVLEVDHIVPSCNGGSNDVINLLTSCWECNHGKADVSLAEVLTGEDPHDRAIVLLERERQLGEYNRVLAEERARREYDAWNLVEYWLDRQGLLTEDQRSGKTDITINKRDYNWLFSALQWCPREQVRHFMDVAVGRYMTKNFRYVAGCARNWRYDMQANKDMKGVSDPYAEV